jgi:beta-glucosidase
MLVRLKLGMFDPPSMNPLLNIPFEATNTPEHRLASLEIAREGVILLRNTKNHLPLENKNLKVALIGPNQDDDQTMMGNYAGTNDNIVTPLKALRNRPGLQVNNVKGCNDVSCNNKNFEDAVKAVQESDVVILTMGLNNDHEQEMTDREDITLPGHQEELIKTVRLAAGDKPVILVLINGGAVTLGNWSISNIDTIIELLYPGQEGGNALVDVLFGDYNPAGRLPMSVYKSLSQLPPFEDMNMTGRTYRYNPYTPQYLFGDGMSYTTFKYSELQVEKKVETCGKVHVKVNVTNSGNRDGDEVVQAYVKHLDAPTQVPLLSLAAFSRIHILVGQTQTVDLVINHEQLSLVLENGDHVVQEGKFAIFVGGNHPRSQMPHAQHLKDSFSVYGDRTLIKQC